MKKVKVWLTLDGLRREIVVAVNPRANIYHEFARIGDDSGFSVGDITHWQFVER